MKTFFYSVFVMTCLFRLSSQIAEEISLHPIRDRLRNLEESINKVFASIGSGIQGACQKEESSLKCCADDSFKNNMCMEFVLILSNFTVRTVFDVNNKTFINEEISEQEPDPICGALPHLHIVKFCFEPYNLGITDGTLNVCLAISGRIGVIEKDIARVDLNCFLFSKDGAINHVEPDSSATNSGIINFKTT